MSTETIDLIRKRFSCRDFGNRIPSDEEIEEVVQAGLHAASAVNRQPWRIIVVKDKDIIDQLETAGLAHLKAQPDQTAYDRIQSRNGLLFYNAPRMIIIACDRNEGESAILDAGIVANNMVLAAESLGMNTLFCGMARTAFQNEKRGMELKRMLQFPAAFDFAISILLGYANTEREPHEIDENKVIRI